MDILSFITIGFIFCVIQFLISSKVKNVWIKSLPIGVSIIGLLFCFIIYIGVFGTASPSVMAENQYFAVFLTVPFAAGFIGCLTI